MTVEATAPGRFDKLADGTAVYIRDWPLPAGIARRGSALIIHGLGEHIERYDHVALGLVSRGIWVRGYDQRGFGRSGGGRGQLPYPNALVDDAKAMLEAFAAEVRAAGDTSKPFLIGHSMGGAIAARAVTGGWIEPRGLVLSSPALKVSMTFFQRLQLLVGRLLLPDLDQPNGLDAHRISHDPAAVAAYMSDPLVHERISARLAQFVIDAGAAARADAGKITAPTLLLVAGDDRLVDAAGSREFFARLPAGLGTLKWYDGLYHEVFNEAAADRARVLADLEAWLELQLVHPSPVKSLA
jgi:alpha-beta hydrolase superfamily lysophospholipase